MFGAIKKLFNRPNDPEPVPATAPWPVTPQPLGKANAWPEENSAAAPIPAAPQPAEGDSLRLSLYSLMRQVPGELHGKNASTVTQDLTLAFPRHQILEQLPQGAVRVPFGQLRRAAPPGVFINTSSQDSRLVDLPLREILGQLQPETFARRPQQQVVDVPNEINDLFGARGERLAPMRVSGKGQTAPLEAPAPAPIPQPAPPARPVAPAQPIRPVAPAPAMRPVAPAPAPMPAPAVAPGPIPFGAAPTSMPMPSAPKVRMPQPEAAPPRNAPAAGEFLLIPLVEIAGSWPEAIRRELTRLNLVNCQCEVPISEISTALKQGKIAYPWKQIFARLKPKPTVRAPSAYDETLLEFPLAVVASSFFTYCQTTRALPKAAPVEAPAPLPPRAQPATVQPAPVQPAFVPPPAAPPLAAPPPPPSPLPPLKLQSAPIHSPLATTPPAPVPATPPPAMAGPPAEEAEAEQEVVTVPLSALSEKWPEPLRKEIQFLHLDEVPLALPVEAIEGGLKQGRVAFQWRQLCHWLHPCPPGALASPFAETRLELPLSVLAPLFLKTKPPGAAQAAALGAEIPDVFQAAMAAMAPPAGAPTEAGLAPAPAAAPGLAPASGKAPQNLAELFGEPNKRNWTPNDIVHKSCSLPGVTGALMALQDGLLVASCMPPDWRTETVAAFLPQIFGRMNQYAKELNMGKLESVAFTLGQGTFHVYHAGMVYFAVLGMADNALPLPQLNLVAAELSRHTQ